MPDLDLRELSAPIEALRPKVTEAYQCIDAKWEAVAKELKSLAIPCVVGVIYWEAPNGAPDNSRLEWRKYKGKKRFCITHYGWDPSAEDGFESIEEIKPYEEWSAEQRLEMFDEIPNLFDVAPGQIEDFIDKAKKLGVE